MDLYPYCESHVCTAMTISICADLTSTVKFSGDTYQKTSSHYFVYTAPRPPWPIILQYTGASYRLAHERKKQMKQMQFD